MRYIIYILFFLLPVTSAWSQPVNVGDTAPDWSLPDKDGQTINYYQDSDNQVSVILFWATWCPYCASLMPHLEVVYRKYRSKGLKFYAIDILEDGKIDPVTYFENKEYSYTLMLDGDAIAENYGVRGTPGLYVVDKNKKVVYKKPAGVSDVLVIQNMDLKIKQVIAK